MRIEYLQPLDRLAPICLMIWTMGLFVSVVASAKPGPNMPVTKRVEQMDDYHGTQVADPYRWLEDDVRESEEVANWVAAQNKVTRTYLDAIPEREQIIGRLTELWDYTKYGIPRQTGGRYFYSKNDGLQNQSVLYIADSPGDDGKVLIDPNTWSEDGTVALAGYSVSDDGKYLAFQKSASGSDWRTIHVMDLESGETLGDEVRWVRFSGIEWSKDNAGFYYNRYPEPEKGEAYQSSALDQKVYYHTVGTSQVEDKLIYERPDEPEWGFDVEATEDGEYVVMTIRKSTDAKNQVLYRRVEDQAWHQLISDFDNQFELIGSEGDTLYLFTDYEAPTKRVVAMRVDKPGREHLQEIIPASKATLEGVSLIDGRLVASYLDDVVSKVKIYSLSGEYEREVPLPGVGSAGGFGGKPENKETFFSFTSFNTPTSIYRYDMVSGEVSLIRQPEVAFEPDNYFVKQVFYKSKDGTRIPMFIAHKKGLELDGENATLLYGYGGFAIPLAPYFSVSRLAWMDLGGVIAVANLRGGGEYGEEWHLAGKLEKKQNVFDDFIAAAEWLIDEGYTKSQKLAIQGGSNGGLLVGAVMTQRPELFGACLPAVGVMDMLRFHHFTAGRYWVAEYGSADVPEQFPVLYAYSPYHNVKPGTAYPATLVTTADTDDRVVPMHSFKFAAALQEAHAGTAQVMIRVETKAGHGRGTPTKKQIEQVADLWAFLVDNLGMQLP